MRAPCDGRYLFAGDLILPACQKLPFVRHTASVRLGLKLTLAFHPHLDAARQSDYLSRHVETAA